eukprot:s3122_g2.t4
MTGASEDTTGSGSAHRPLSDIRIGTPTTSKGPRNFSPTPASTTLGSQDASPQTILTEVFGSRLDLVRSGIELLLYFVGVDVEDAREGFSSFDLDSLTLDMVDFQLPPPAISTDEGPTAEDLHGGDSADAATWSCNARLPQLRIRTFRMSPFASPQTSPLSAEKPRRRSSRAADETPMMSATRAQLREGATGVEDVLNRVRYDLQESFDLGSFTVLVENAELPDLCRHHLLRGDCRYGQHCRYQHLTPVRWLSGSFSPPSSSGSHVTHVEAMESSKLFLLLDSAPSHTARHALLQTVAFVLFRGEVVWCRHIGRPDRQQLWDSFLAMHGAEGRTASRGDALLAELMMRWPGSVWERLLSHLQDPCVISGVAAGLLCSCRSVYQSSLADPQLWEMLTRAEWFKEWPSLANAAKSSSAQEPLKRYTDLSRNVHLYRLCWTACQSCPGKFATPKLGPDKAPAEIMAPTSPNCEARRSGATVHVEVGFEVTALRASSSLTVAASRRSNEVRLFQSRGLGRLPALRLLGRPGVDALDLAPANDVLVAGGIDGQLTLHTLSDPGNSFQRLGRFCKPSSRYSQFPTPLFAGLHFVQGSGGTQVLAAARSLNSAQILDVVQGAVLQTCTVGSQDLVACEPLGEHALLMNAEGMVRLWDARAPEPVRLADFALAPAECEDGPHLSVNVGDPAPVASPRCAQRRSGRRSFARLALPAWSWRGGALWQRGSIHRLYRSAASSVEVRLLLPWPWPGRAAAAEGWCMKFAQQRHRCLVWHRPRLSEAAMSTITIFYAGRKCRPSLTSGAATPDACLRGALQGNGDPGMLATPLVSLRQLGPHITCWAAAGSSIFAAHEMQEALAWASLQLEGVFLPSSVCCCSPGKGPEAGGKYGDLVVFSDWDTAENAPGFTDGPRLSGPSEARSSQEYGPDDLEEPSAAREVVQLRELMKNFVQEMVVGRDVTIVVEAGQTESGWLRLTPNLLALRLEAAGVSHEMLLRNIKDVRPGALNDNQGPVKLDQLCNTLCLKSGECISFRFQSIAERDKFGKCIKVLALALEQ